MPTFLRPLDWQDTNARPIFAIERGDTTCALQLRIVQSDEYFKSPLTAPVIFSKVLRPDAQTVVTFRLREPLADGTYVVFAVREDDPEAIVADSGFKVNDPYRDIVFPLQDTRAKLDFNTLTMPFGLAPIAIDVVRDGSVPRRLNIVLPSLLKEKFSGGPNTAFALGQVLADRGVPVNFISTETGAEADVQVLRDHLATLTGIEQPRAQVTFTPGNERSRPAVIGHTDLMMGTAWWTVQKFKHCLADLRTPKFIYLIQEFEPGLYPYSSHYALAAETYTLDHLPLFNHRFLYDYFKANVPGTESGTWFDPVIDSRRFFYDRLLRLRAGRQRTLLFYARPTVALRNLYEIGCGALAKLAGEGVLDERWKLHSMGERAGDIYLPREMVVEELPWMDLDGYARRMRSCDVLLSLMLSPHPSYPPLEGAASGAVVVTNAFANKSADELAAISRNILAVAPTIDGVAEGIRQAVTRLKDTASRRQASKLAMPSDWVSALSETAERVLAFWNRS